MNTRIEHVSEISTHLIYPEDKIPAEVLEKLKLPNPEYEKRQKFGQPLDGVPEYINLYFTKEGRIYIPRAYNVGLPVDRDLRAEGHKVDFKFLGKLRPYQEPAVEALVNTENGIVQAGCGSGKTILSLAAAAKVGVTTLVFVHKEFLLNQWVDRIREFLGEKAGIVRGDTWDWKGRKIVVAMLQTLYSRRNEIPEEFLRYFGLTISDEVHRVAASTWSQVVTMFPSKRRWGLTATIKRSDGLENVFLYHIGPVVYKIEGQRMQPKVYFYLLDFEYDEKKWIMKRSGEINVSKMVTDLSNHWERTKKVLEMTMRAALKGRKVIVFSERVAHLELMNEKFNEVGKDYGVQSGLYIGKMSQEERDRVVETCDVLFATFQIAREGLDIPELDTAIFATPVSNDITVEQSVGRITREYEGKKEPVVIDFVDRKHDILRAMAAKRKKIYERLGYEIHILRKKRR